MSQKPEAFVPALEGNAELFSSVFKLACAQAQQDCLPVEVILVQIIYHASYELFYSDMPLRHVQGTVEAAALTVAKEYEEAETQEAGGGA